MYTSVGIDRNISAGY